MVYTGALAGENDGAGEKPPAGSLLFPVTLILAAREKFLRRPGVEVRLGSIILAATSRYAGLPTPADLRRKLLSICTLAKAKRPSA